MTSGTFEASVRRRGDTAIIDLSGDVNRDAEQDLRAAYEEARASEPANILLNFARVHYINSTGIALIVGVLAESRKEGMTVTACGLSDHYREIFEITRLSDFMSIFESEDGAVADVPA
jgi:anti-sigma B factor antagonist